jgi:MoxR-like ATPase
MARAIVGQVITPEELTSMQWLAAGVRVTDPLVAYLVELVRRTREDRERLR